MVQGEYGVSRVKHGHVDDYGANSKTRIHSWTLFLSQFNTTILQITHGA